MAEMLLINPRRRRRAAKASARRTTRRVSRRVTRRRRNPAAPVAIVQRAVRRIVRRRRSNPSGRIIRAVRRRRNPISVRGVTGGMMSMFQQAAVGGAGAVVFDVLMGKVNPYLPASLQTSPNAVGVGDAVKAFATAVIGNALSRSTKGLSKQMAMGALISQFRDIASSFLPPSLALGYATPGFVVRGSGRVGPNRTGIAAYARPGQTALLNGMGAYAQPASSALLSSASRREGVKYR